MTFIPVANEDKIGYCIKIILKEARKEDRLVRQLFYTMLSMYTNDPRNMAINSPTGEGKNYIIHKVVSLFPKEDVLLLSGMSEKSLFHRNGPLVIKNEKGEYEFIEERLKPIESTIEDKQSEIHTTKDANLKQALKAQIEELLDEKKALYRDAKKLIDLSHKTLVFLDTPPQGLFTAIMSLLSHDEYETEYEYVDTNNGIKTHSNVLRGWPVVIFAQAIDYSHYKRYPEIQRRFVITNPKMDQEKYASAIDLTCDRYGLPDFMYQHEIVNDLQKDQAREIIKGFKERMLDICSSIEPGKNNIFVPFKDAISSSLSKNRASDMTLADRILGYLTLIAAINAENRPVIKLRKEGHPVAQTIVLATFEDLQEALYLIQYANGVRPYILEWYYDVFLPTYNMKTEPDSKVKPHGKDGNVIERIENRIAVTTQQLSDATMKILSKKLSSKQIREAYLDQLINEGYVDNEKSEVNRSADIYFPISITTKEEAQQVAKTAVFEVAPLNTARMKVIVENSSIFPRCDYIISKIDSLLEVAFRNGFTHMNNPNSSQEIADIYYKNPKEYFELKESSVLAYNDISNQKDVTNATSQNDANLKDLQANDDKHEATTKFEVNETVLSGDMAKTDVSATSEDISTEYSTNIGRFGCFYCDESFSNDGERINHFDYGHPGKLKWPEPEDFVNRFRPNR